MPVRRMCPSRGCRKTSICGARQCRANTCPSKGASSAPARGARVRARFRVASRAASAAVCKVGSTVTGMSGFYATVQGDDPAGEIVVLTLDEARVFEHLPERVLVGMHAYGFGEIAVALAIIGHNTADARQYVERVGVVQSAQQGAAWLRELKHQQSTAGFQHPQHGAQREILVGDVAQAERDADAVEAVVG